MAPDIRQLCFVWLWRQRRQIRLGNHKVCSQHPWNFSAWIANGIRGLFTHNTLGPTDMRLIVFAKEWIIATVLQETNASEAKFPLSAVGLGCESSSDNVRWLIGDMLWARVTGHPWWPCMVGYYPQEPIYTRVTTRKIRFSIKYLIGCVIWPGLSNHWSTCLEQSSSNYSGSQSFSCFQKAVETTFACY